MGAYEAAAVELQLACAPSDPSWPTVTQLLDELASLSADMAVEEELEQLSGLRQLTEQFRPGEVDEMVAADAPRRTLVHSGVLFKTVSIGKVPRHYFLFSDGSLLTAEQPKPGGMRGKAGSVAGSVAGSALSCGSSVMGVLRSSSSRGAADQRSSSSAPVTMPSGASFSSAAGDSNALLKKCKWLSLDGSHLHVPPDADPCYFEICYGGPEDKINRLWTETADQRTRWLRRLLQVLQKLTFPPLPPHPPRQTATDRSARLRMRGRVACYAREAALLSGGWHAAVASEDASLLTSLLEKQPQRAALPECVLGGSPLHLAVEMGNLRAVEALIEATTSLSAPPLLELNDRDDLSALYVAALCLCAPTPAAPSPPPPEEESKEHEVASSHPRVAPPPPVDTATRLQILRRLLAAGADANGADAAAPIDSPLLMCIGAGQQEAVAALCEAGANVRVACRGGAQLPALHLAILSRQSQCVRSLLASGIGVASPPGQRSTLHLACSQRVPDAEILRALLDHGAQPNQADPSSGKRPLQLMLSSVPLLTSRTDPSSVSSSASDADILAEACACTEALVLGGSRLDGPLATGEVHPSILHVARAAATRFKAEGKEVPRLQPVANSALSASVHAQLGAGWVDDKTAAGCMACGTAFTSMVRRHHCRLLGIVVCDVCSSRRAVLPSQGVGGVRVCDAAFNVVKHPGRLADRYDLNWGQQGGGGQAHAAAAAAAARERGLDVAARWPRPGWSCCRCGGTRGVRVGAHAVRAAAAAAAAPLLRPTPRVPPAPAAARQRLRCTRRWMRCASAAG